MSSSSSISTVPSIHEPSERSITCGIGTNETRPPRGAPINQAQQCEFSVWPPRTGSQVSALCHKGYADSVVSQSDLISFTAASGGDTGSSAHHPAGHEIRAAGLTRLALDSCGAIPRRCAAGAFRRGCLCWFGGLQVVGTSRSSRGVVLLGE